VEPILCVKRFRCVRIILSGIEVMHTISKWQMQCRRRGVAPTAAHQFKSSAT
jgi:hypothetical protein